MCLELLENMGLLHQERGQRPLQWREHKEFLLGMLRRQHSLDWFAYKRCSHWGDWFALLGWGPQKAWSQMSVS